jgi:large subunit ribosomal protein L24
VSIGSGDPDVLTAWLQGRSDGTYRNQKPLRLRGDAVIAADRIGLDGMKAEINGGKIDGSIALLTTADNKTRLEAVLSAPSLDVESVSSLVSVLAGAAIGMAGRSADRTRCRACCCRGTGSAARRVHAQLWIESHRS